MTKPKFVYVTFIATTPEKLWEALTKGDISVQYWFGFRVEASGKPGDVMTAYAPSGQQVHRDPIIESDPPRRLVYGWQPLFDEFKGEQPSRVTFDIEPKKGQVKLTVTHDGFAEDSKVFPKISDGWPAVLSSLKTFLETGRSLQSNWVPPESQNNAQRAAG